RLLHSHPVTHLDGPDCHQTPPPAWATLDLLRAAVDHAAGAVTITTPAAGGVPAMTHAWGSQIDVRPITTTGELTDGAVAGYIAKCATKAAECVGTLDRRVRPTDDRTELPFPERAPRRKDQFLPRPPGEGCGWTNGPTCSASAAPSPPNPATTPPPSARCEQLASTTTAPTTTSPPPADSRSPQKTKSSSSPTGATSAKASRPARPCWPPL